ncbi:MAG: efflux RND transporter periplasmic adaptor subunit [Candidatus Binataceae bacterium]
MAEGQHQAPAGSGPLFYFGWLAAVVIVLVTLAGLVLAREVWIRRQADVLEEEEQRGPVVLVTPVEQVPLKRTVVFPADIHGYFESPIYPKVPGYIESMLVDKGMRVKKNQLLAVLVSPELDQMVVDARANYDIAAITDRRNQILVKQSVISQEDADTSHSTMLSNEAKWKSLVAQQAYERVLAPYDGIVTERNLDPGALVALSTAQQGAQAIVKMATLKPVRIYVSMPQDDAAFVKVGDPAQVTVSQFPGRIFTGSVTRHPDALMNSTRTMLVEVDLANDDFTLLPGMYAHVEITLSGSAGTPLVPDDALVFQNGKTYVPTVKDDRIHLVEVMLGQDDGIRCQVVQGLSGNEVVAINLGQTAHDGELVRTQPVPHP